MSDALYVLTNEYLEAANQLQDLDLDDATIRDTLEGLQHPIEQKATNIAFVIRNMESLAEQIKAAEQQMSARRKAMENRADNVREYLLEVEVRHEIEEIGSLPCGWEGGCIPYGGVDDTTIAAWYGPYDGNA